MILLPSVKTALRAFPDQQSGRRTESMRDALFLLVLVAGFGAFLALLAACDHIIRATGSGQDEESAR